MISIAKKTYVKSSLKMTGLIEENPYLLLMMQHFNMDFTVEDKSVARLCAEYDISENVFITIANLYNGHDCTYSTPFSTEELLSILSFLQNSHAYYRRDSYPQISHYIRQIQTQCPQKKELQLLEEFWNTYFREVLEHLDYEDKVAFPYFSSLLHTHSSQLLPSYSAQDYLEHHTDIELKLDDLKQLLLKHIHLDNFLDIRRRLLFSLFELEFDLYIHSLIEEHILVPAGYKAEETPR